jgi:hypothetical protein
MAGTMAAAMLGRPDEALATLEMLQADVVRMGAQRWVSRPLNLRGWIARNLGAGDEADELNLAAIDAARLEGFDEPLANGLLDLAAGRLFEGDLDAAGVLLDEALPFAEVEHAFRWRHQLRGRLLRARLDLAEGASDVARDGAESLAADASALGATRYAVQGGLIAAVSASHARAAVDLDGVGGLLVRLDEVAGLEGWWITAEVAQVFGVHEWEQLAEHRVSALHRRAGPYGETLARAAARRLA